MSKCIHNDELHAHFVTFSCYRRRRLMERDRPKQIVLEILASQLDRTQGRCLGFVIMPDHVHTVLWFSRPAQVSGFMKGWKQRSSFRIKKFLRSSTPKYVAKFDISDPVWQARYHAFNIYSDKMLLQKLQYMHGNPVKAGLAASPSNWAFSSARFYETGQSVGVPVEFDM